MSQGFVAWELEHSEEIMKHTCMYLAILHKHTPTAVLHTDTHVPHLLKAAMSSTPSFLAWVAPNAAMDKLS